MAATVRRIVVQVDTNAATVRRIAAKVCRTSGVRRIAVSARRIGKVVGVGNYHCGCHVGFRTLLARLFGRNSMKRMGDCGADGKVHPGQPLFCLGSVTTCGRSSRCSLEEGCDKDSLGKLLTFEQQSTSHDSWRALFHW
jgi:hypothetical protein